MPSVDQKSLVSPSDIEACSIEENYLDYRVIYFFIFLAKRSIFLFKSDNFSFSKFGSTMVYQFYG